MKSLTITKDAHGVVFAVSDGDRNWRLGIHTPLPPQFFDYDAFQEVQYVLHTARQMEAPKWVIEKLQKYLQTLR